VRLVVPVKSAKIPPDVVSNVGDVITWRAASAPTVTETVVVPVPANCACVAGHTIKSAASTSRIGLCMVLFLLD
jgi:hypothetical protein